MVGHLSFCSKYAMHDHRLFTSRWSASWLRQTQQQSIGAMAFELFARRLQAC